MRTKRALYAPCALDVVAECRQSKNSVALTAQGNGDWFWWCEPSTEFRYRVRTAQGWRWVLDPYADGLTDSTWGARPLEAYWQSYLDHETFDWSGERQPNLPWSESVIYELHPRGFTANGNSRVAAPGTYAGLTEKLPYLRDLGVTTLELLPIWHFSETDNPRTNPTDNTPLRNYWGYQPLSQFAVKGGYACSQEAQCAADEFKDFVRSAHQVGLEVILDVVLNHTGQADNPFHLPGFDALAGSEYYLEDSGGPIDVTGCGNTLNPSSDTGFELMLASLKHWVTNYHIDGFRYDLGATFFRSTSGVLQDESRVVEAIKTDQLLRQVKHAFEPWDAAGGRTEQHINEPLVYWDDKFRDACKAIVNGHTTDPTELANALAVKANRVSMITCHDGFTLWDLLSYCQKQNHDNGEQNRDGHNNNLSTNFGIEGATATELVHSQRERRAKNFMALLMLAPGTPLLTAGDEFLRTQLGNNNGYSLDSQAGWLNWDSLNHSIDFLVYVRQLIRLRKNLLAQIQQGWQATNLFPGRLSLQAPGLTLLCNFTEDQWALSMPGPIQVLLDTSSPIQSERQSRSGSLNLGGDSVLLMNTSDDAEAQMTFR